MINIGVIFPSRGLSMSQTCEELLRELEGYKHTIHFSHGRPIPDCFNVPLEKALKGKHTHFWFVEDDMVLPEFILTKLLDMNKPIVACDYPIVKKPSGTILYDSKDVPFFTGTGCMLATRESLEKMPKPIFRSDITWGFRALNGKAVLNATKTKDTNKVYGHHDITFGLWHYMKEPITVCPIPLSQRKLKNMGKQGTNKGQHDIELYNKLKKQNQVVKSLSKDYKEPPQGLVAIRIGKQVTNTCQETATRLVLAGKAQLLDVELKYKDAILDFGDCEDLMGYFK